VYNMLIHGYSQQRDISAATSVLEKMVLRGIVPNEASYNSLVRCLCGAGKVQEAQSIVAMAARRGITVDEWAWSAMIQVRNMQAKHACARGRHRVHVEPAPPHTHAPCHSRSPHACMQAHVEEGDLHGARDAMARMFRAGVKAGPTAHCQLLHSCRLEASPTAAKAAAARVWKRLVALRAPLTVECYNAMLSITLVGDPECVSHALAAVAEMRARGLPARTDTFNTIMHAAVENGDFLQVRAACSRAPTPLRACSHTRHACRR
jgi:pentatricopeptide repeat protein